MRLEGLATISVYIPTVALECSGIFLSPHLLLHPLLNSIKWKKKKQNKTHTHTQTSRREGEKNKNK